ncbi:hypothetical protein A946_00100 [Methylacidiphilum kamchatkense Kam1]|uniref:MatE protein n=1 Tax=Methylacidiphilum kamchatkense Kam1 TaxID=1202785 RepID=A0ABR4ZYC3_9BACT|nr:MATE family efflux transporter [Methylacidiphilum kamchatkense]KIE59182.1 hypothetical protein A946_00100 [Methylacidiphilum kamchatkense Kam1]
MKSINIFHIPFSIDFLNFSQKSLEHLKKHVNNLFPLWSSYGLVSISNALSMLILVAKLPQNIFAAYIITQTISFLVNAWTDSGVSAGIQVLSSQEHNNKKVFEAYKKAGTALSLKLILVMGCILWGLIFSFHLKGNFFEKNSICIY